MNILQNSNWITHSHILSRIRNLNIESRPTMPKANKSQMPNLQKN